MVEGNALVFPPKSVYIQGSEVLIKYLHALYVSRKSLICDLNGYVLTEWPEFVGGFLSLSLSLSLSHTHTHARAHTHTHTLSPPPLPPSALRPSVEVGCRM